MIIKWEEFLVLIDLIGLITSADFNRFSIDLKFVIIDFRISADSQPYYIHLFYYVLILVIIHTSLKSLKSVHTIKSRLKFFILVASGAHNDVDHKA